MGTGHRVDRPNLLGTVDDGVDSTGLRHRLWDESCSESGLSGSPRVQQTPTSNHAPRLMALLPSPAVWAVFVHSSPTRRPRIGFASCSPGRAFWGCIHGRGKKAWQGSRLAGSGACRAHQHMCGRGSRRDRLEAGTGRAKIQVQVACWRWILAPSRPNQCPCVRVRPRPVPRLQRKFGVSGP